MSQVFVDKLRVNFDSLRGSQRWSELCRKFLQYKTLLENDPISYLNSDTFSPPAVLPLLFKPASGGTHLFHPVKHSSCQQDSHLRLGFCALESAHELQPGCCTHFSSTQKSPWSVLIPWVCEGGCLYQRQNL